MSVDSSIRIAAFGRMKIQECLSKNDAPTKSDCLVRFMGWRHNTGRIFSKMRPVRQYCDDVRDREMITKCLCPESEDMDVHDMWFQENTDG